MGFGVIACGAMSPDLLETEIAATQALTRRPFGVNLITMHPQLDDLIRVCLRLGVGHIVLAGGIPPGTAVRMVKDGGVKLIAFTPALVLAKRLVRTGVDALVIEGSEAGGHIGPVSLTVLAQEILPFVREVPIFVAGGIGRGEAILAYLEMGASGAQLGTRFAASTESIAHPRFKQAFIRANARDALPSIQLDERFPVIPVRGLVNDGTRKFLDHQADTLRRFQAGEFDREQAQLAIETFWAGALRRAVIDGDVEQGSVMGRPVGRHGHRRAADRRDHRRTGRPGGWCVAGAVPRGQPGRLRRGRPDVHAAPAARPPARGDGAQRDPAPPNWCACSPPRWSARSARSTRCAPARCWSSPPPRACAPKPLAAPSCASARASSASPRRPRKS